MVSVALAEPLNPADSPAPFSLLVPVYRGDSAHRVRRAIDSNTHEQTRPPAQVVIVRDGPVPQEITDELDRISAASAVPVVRVELEHNAGLTNALNTGLLWCSHDVVARADADDISYPDRFASTLR